MNTLYAVETEMDKNTSDYVQTPPTVEKLRAKVKELRKVLELGPEENAAKLLRDTLEMNRTHLAALLLRSDRVLWDKYMRVLVDANNNVPPTGVLSREDAEALFGL